MRCFIIVRVLSIFVGLLLAFFVLESYFRLFDPQMVFDECRVHDVSRVVQEEGVGFVLRPNLSWCEYQWDSHKRINFSTNSAGLRMLTEVGEKKEGMKRVVLLGDSFVEGLFLDDCETFGYVLDDLLPEEFEVINMGVSGTGTAQQVVRFEKHGLKYDPDVVMLLFYPNDFSDSVRLFPTFAVNNAGVLRGPVFKFVENEPGRRSWFMRTITRFSHASAFLYDAKERLFRRERLDSTVTSMYETFDVEMELGSRMVFGLLGRLKDVSELEGFRLMVVYVPAKVQFEGGEGLIVGKPNGLLKDFAGRLNVSFMDLSDVLGWEDYFVEDNHLSPAGAQKIATRLGEWLKVEGVVS